MYLSVGYGVVGSFLGDVDIVGMALFETCAGDADKLCFLLQLGDSGSTAVTHTGAQTAHQLVDGLADRSAIGNTTLDAFGNELLGAGLEVTVGGALVHAGFEGLIYLLGPIAYRKGDLYRNALELG